MEGRSCPSCGTENPRGRGSACRAGGAPADLSLLRRREPAGGQVLHRVRHRADGRAGAAPPGPAPAAGAPEERRKATVLFADLSGYTAVAERMDPEAVKSIVDRALRRLGGGHPLRRPRRQVHRRQRDGRLRRAGRARGRPRARRPGRAGDAGRDGGDQRAIAGPGRRASCCGWGSTPARCWRARSATDTR